jgi:dTDP-4-dehydrorhamnose reductase
MERKSSKTPELWGGLECSFNRVNDAHMDQLQRCGHYDRIAEDLDCLSVLGIKAMRYPVIWERLQPSPNQPIPWDKTVTPPLERLRSCGITPIVGLVHHGSGPGYADIRSPAFAPGLSEFAFQVAKKYPWVEYYAPVNEPLTTARFCGLYGLWFPHEKNDRAFARIFVNEMTGVVRAMQNIRKINPDAKLIQSEDLGKTYSTPRLKYQADFENHRRWLTCDMLCGMVTRQHPMWEYFIESGIRGEELDFFADNPCPPAIVGADYYATSERYLDEQMEKYPPATHGGNHFEQYADVEMVRVKHNQQTGVKVLLRECWERHRLPIALTEVHIKCDSDNQIRWFAQVRNACIDLMKEGVDIRAVTMWSLFGSFGWSTLLTAPDGEYESGAFDIQSGIPLQTPLGAYLVRLAQNPQFVHLAENEKGWWELEERFFERMTTQLVADDDPHAGLCI